MLTRLAFRTVAVSLALNALGGSLPAQHSKDLPFGPGERFEYTGRVHKGISGAGVLWIDAPSELRGVPTWTLHSDMEGSFGFLHASDKNASWLDPARMTSLRYTAQERHLLKRHDDVIDIFADEKRWSAQGGLTGTIVSDAPLDELSFLYYLRTIALPTDSVMTLSRHFDTTRNPTLISVVGREDVEVPAGKFHAVIVEMRVRDTRHYNGEGIIKFAFSDDKCRLILRIESDVPDAGSAALYLKAYSGNRAECSAAVK